MIRPTFAVHRRLALAGIVVSVAVLVPGLVLPVISVRGTLDPEGVAALTPQLVERGLTDETVAALRMYDSIGKHIRDIGRSGAGPRVPDVFSMKGLKAGGFAVWDTRNARITTFDASGGYITEFPALSSLYFTHRTRSKSILPAITT